MKKIIVFLITLLLIVGCACAPKKASDPVKEYLEKYNNQDSEIMSELEELIKQENLTEEQAKKYKEIMKKQYDDLKYKIEEEIYNGEEATVKTKITVYDLYTVQKDAEEYKKNHQDEFKNDTNAFLDYKLEQMKKSDKRVEYTIEFQVAKKEDKWVLKSVSTEALEKIHGIYNYGKD